MRHHARVIPPGWEEHHRPVAESTMTAIADLTQPSLPPAYGQTEVLPGPPLATDIPVRVQQVRGESRGEAAGQLVDSRRYLVTAPVDRIPRFTTTDHGPIIWVRGYLEGHEGDPHLINRPLRVTNIQHGSLIWERDLSCVDDTTNS